MCHLLDFVQAPSEFEEGLDNAVKQDATSISNMEMVTSKSKPGDIDQTCIFCLCVQIKSANAHDVQETISFKALLDRLAKEGGQICILDLGLKDIVRNALENQGSG